MEDEELELLWGDGWAKAVHRRWPKWDLIPLSIGARDLGMFVVKVVANVGRNDLSLPNGAGDNDPMIV